jgi:hypothetical protein
MIEGARVSTAKVYAERALTTAMDSVLAEYYGPLWEEYHLFGYNKGNGREEEQREQIIAKLTDYMSYTFTPEKGFPTEGNSDALEFYDISLSDMEVNQQTRLTDYQGHLFINETVEYMKYRELGHGLELLFDKMKLLETPKKVSVIYEEKEALEEELIEIDEGILELMELLDGIKTCKKRIELREDGRLQSAEYFIKKFCFEEITKENVAIYQEDIFKAVKNNYWNPSQEFGIINNNYMLIEEVLQDLQEIEAEREEKGLILLELQDQLNELNSVEKKTEELKNEINNVKESINGIAAQRRALQQEARYQEKLKSQLESGIKESKRKLSQTIHQILPLLEEAISIVDNLIYKTEIAKPLVEEYETSLYSAKEWIGEDIFAGLEENLKELKRYTGTELNGYDFIAMMDTLEANRLVLMDVEHQLNQGESELTQKMNQASKMTFENAENEFENYMIKNLVIDYSTLVLDHTKQKNPLDMVENILQAGLASLVIDPNTISKGRLTDEALPSVVAAINKDKTDFISKITSYFEESIIGGKNLGMNKLFNNFDDIDQVMSMIGNGINKVSEHILFQEYLKEHFTQFPKEGENLKKRKPSALLYEQEYLLVGKNSDQENLSSIITKLIFYRTILDFVSLLGDKAKCNEAKLVATSLVGFTGLPILIGVTQTLILIIWSFAEALLDVCSLMLGKEVPVLKKKIVMEFADLFLINRNYLQTKASQIVEGKELSLSYQDYLRIFLLLKDKEDLAYRSMDLIQVNLNRRYEDTFHIDNCLFGYQVVANFKIAPKFSSFPFVQKHIGENNTGFLFSKKATYSY